jgi:hypothetical protein
MELIVSSPSLIHNSERDVELALTTIESSHLRCLMGPRLIWVNDSPAALRMADVFGPSGKRRQYNCFAGHEFFLSNSVGTESIADQLPTPTVSSLRNHTVSVRRAAVFAAVS